MFKTERKVFCIVGLIAIFYLWASYTVHLRKVVADQRTYIESGSQGRYQGEEE